MIGEVVSIVCAVIELALFAPLAVLVIIVLLQTVWPSPEERLVRTQRRHAERTARSIRRMGQIRRDTIARMDEAERRR